jgi:hypothetical protein
MKGQKKSWRNRKQRYKKNKGEEERNYFVHPL